jgi:hypothetical protein
MDWSNLNTLHLNQPSYTVLRLLKGAVPKLKHISFTGGTPKDAAAIVDFIGTTALPLESLSLNNLRLNSFDNVIDVIIQHHGGSVKHLNLTGRVKAQNSRLFLNETTLSQLYSSCPNLETLGIDIASTTKWDYSLLDGLVSHPKLRHLTLRFELQDNNTRSPDMGYGYMLYDDYGRTEGSSTAQCLVNATSAPGLFRYLRSRKIGRQLESLDLHIYLRNEGLSPYAFERREVLLEDYKCRSVSTEICLEQGNYRFNWPDYL